MILIHCMTYLEIPEPNPVIEEGEGEDVVVERLGLRVALRGGEGLLQHLLQNLG